MKRRKSIVICILIAVLSLSVVFFLTQNGKKTGVSELKDQMIGYEETYGGVHIFCFIDDFNELGFSYGDSVDVLFSNGYQLSDIPYYSGYYGEVNKPMLLGFSSYPFLRAIYYSGGDLWEDAGLTENDTATIRLHEKGKYANIQQIRDMSYGNDRNDYPSAEAFANFRSIDIPSMAKDTFYRSATPWNWKYERPPYVSQLCEEAGIRYIVDLSDSKEKLEQFMNDLNPETPYMADRYKTGDVDTVGLNMDYTSEEFREKVCDSIENMTEHEGPYLIHCTEGKDRTGFVCIVLESLSGASYEEIKDDFMISFENYYKVTEQNEKRKYDEIVRTVFTPMVKVLVKDGSDIQTADLQKRAEEYLEAGGMSGDEIQEVKELLKTGVIADK